METAITTLTIEGKTRALFSIDETAGLLGQSRPTIYKLIKRGRLQTVRLSSRQYVTAGSLAALIPT